MTLSRTRSIGVDPYFHIKRELLCDLHLVRATSDEFFAREHPLAHFDEPVIDLAFIDGMHLAEYALRDFINTERLCHPGSVIVFDDMLPRSIAEANRDRGLPREEQEGWAGDVYKVTQALLAHRPDLIVLEMDTQPTGTLVVLLPDPDSRVLADACDDLVESYIVADPQPVPEAILRRTRRTDPAAFLAAPIWDDLRSLQGGLTETDAAVARDRIRTGVVGRGFNGG